MRDIFKEDDRVDKSKLVEEMETVVKADVKPKAAKKPVRVEKVVKVSEGNVLNVRSEAKTGNNVVGTFKNGEAVTVYGTEGEFSVIRYKGKPAYVMSSKLVEK